MSPGVVVDGRRIRLTNLNRLLWPDAGLTKADLVGYVTEAARAALPYLRQRPLALRRYPTGAAGPSFVQKACPEHAPDWIPRVTVQSGSGRAIPYILGNDRATLVWLANQGAIELHPWHARAPRLAQPDWVVFDLDPIPPYGLREAAEVACALNRQLAALGAAAWVKTSGGRGLHVYLPLASGHTHRQAHLFARLAARMLAQRLPGQLSLERRPAARRGRVYVDVDQNGRGKTLAAPFLPRGRAGAPVSMPIPWAAVEAGVPQRFTLRDARAALAAGTSAFQGLRRHGFQLERLTERARGMVADVNWQP